MNISHFSMSACFEGHSNMARLQPIAADLASFVCASPVRRPMDEIAKEILDKYYTDVTMKEVMSEIRFRRVCRARQHIWAAIIDERYDITIETICRKFRRDHQTIIYGIKQHRIRASRRRQGLPA